MNRKELLGIILTKIREKPGMNITHIRAQVSAPRHEIANAVITLAARGRLRAIGDDMPRKWEINPDHPEERMARDETGGNDENGEPQGWIE